jgi:TonB family protein
MSIKLRLPATESPPSLPQDTATSLTLLITLEPWYRGLLRNFSDLFSTPESPLVSLSSTSAAFWPDVFVGSRLPWRRFAESAVLHGLSIFAVCTIARLGPLRPHPAVPLVFSGSDVIRYQLAEYLPTLESAVESSEPAKKGAPAKAAQAIVSVPANSENHRQTIVSPPNLALNDDTPLPNIVAWAQPDPRIPAAATAAGVSELRQAQLPASAIAPPPEVEPSRIEPIPVLSQAVIAPAPEIQTTLRTGETPAAQPAIAPPPAIEMASLDRRDINIGRAQVVSPAPQLPVGAQRTLPAMSQASLSKSATTVVPPPPREEGAQISTEHGRLVALNVQPAPPRAVEMPNGNRRGAFAAGPEGKADAPGTPDIPIEHTPTKAPPTSAFGSVFGKSAPGLPPGLLVGTRGKTESTPSPGGGTGQADPEPGSGDSRLIAKASLPRAVAREIPADQETEIERQVFGARRSYGMTLSVPNLNSSAGSWVMHFSEVQEGETRGDLLAPVATRTVAPAYPLELMRENVEGTVTLSALIASDGHVQQVTILTGTNDRLNEFARNALLGWRFLPALRDGKPVALQAVVRIPFKPIAKTRF